MSLLNPVLLPPKVKAYLSQGERFIKWDDVSGAGAVGAGTLGHRAGLLGALPGWGVGLGLSGLRRLCSLARQPTQLRVNKPGGLRECAPHICPWAAEAKALCLDVRNWRAA